MAERKKRLVVLTGSGISAESGLKTFREAGGLWEGHDVGKVATPEAFRRDPEMVLRFYNERRRQLDQVEPNAGHRALVELEKAYDVDIITQNVDDLHERAGSTRILHLHGELRKGRSAVDDRVIVTLDGDINPGDTAPDGHPLRPHVVWFGEAVPMFPVAAEIAARAEILLVVGSSLVVYPANTLVEYASPRTPVYVVDPVKPSLNSYRTINFIEAPATEGVPTLVRELLTIASE